METTVAYAPKISSGIDVVDETWGGLYQGASYLIYGRTVAGRGLLPLRFAQDGVREGQRCFYVTSETFDDLAKRAQGPDFSLKKWINAGVLEIVQIPPFGGADDTNDEILARAMSSLVSAVEEKRPHRVAIDTFMPFVSFRSFGRFRTSFISMLERVDAVNATLMLVVAEPANEESEHVIEFMRAQTTAAIHVELSEQNGDGVTRKLSMIPGIGHTGQAAVKYWHVRAAEPARPEARRGRRFRFSEEADEEPTVSLRDARWDVADGEPESYGSSPERELNGATSHDAPGPDYLITPYRLGRPRAESHYRKHPIEVGGKKPVVEPIPLGRLRHQTEQSHVDQPLTATITPRRASGEPERKSSEAKPAEARAAEFTSIPFETAFETVSHTDRESFRARLQQRFLRSSVNDVPFLLIAMRMDRREQASSRPFDFEFILDLVNELLRDQDDVYVDLERERLVVMLADTEAEGSRRFFAELRRRLREEAPHQADYLLQSVSAIVVPNGRPFQNAEEFLSYALSEAQ